MKNVIGGPGYEKKEGPAPEPEKDDGDGEELGSKAAKAAVKTLFSAMETGDVDAGVKALKSFMSACE